MGRAAGDPFDPVGNAAVAVDRALAEASVELDAAADIDVTEHNAATVMLVARALGIDADGINRAGGAVATGNAGSGRGTAPHHRRAGRAGCRAAAAHHQRRTHRLSGHRVANEYLNIFQVVCVIVGC